MEQFNDMKHSLRFNFHRESILQLSLFSRPFRVVTGIDYNKLPLERHKALLETVLDFKK